MVEPHTQVPGSMTVDEFFALPDDGKRYELLDGVVQEMTAPNTKHQRVVLRLAVLLVHALQDEGFGEVFVAPYDIVLDDRTVLQPDVVFVANERAGIVNERNVRGTPDLVVEVLSPNPRIGSTEERVGWYAEYGVRECWLIHQDRSEVAVIGFADRRLGERRLCHARDPIASDVLPQFSDSLNDILDV
jgi:Uma2 family endonuclease